MEPGSALDGPCGSLPTLDMPLFYDILKQLSKFRCAKSLLRYMTICGCLTFLPSMTVLEHLLIPRLSADLSLHRGMRWRSKGSRSPRAGEITALFPFRKHHLLLQPRNAFSLFDGVRWDELHLKS